MRNGKARDFSKKVAGSRDTQEEGSRSTWGSIARRQLLHVCPSFLLITTFVLIFSRQFPQKQTKYRLKIATPREGDT
jgi:hypothetical protein